MSGEMNGCDSQQFEADVGRMGEKEVTKQSSHLYHKTLIVESHTNHSHLLFRIGYLARALPFFISPLEFTRSLLSYPSFLHFLLSFCAIVFCHCATLYMHT